MAHRTELFKAVSEYIQEHNYAMLQGLPAIGKSSFAYELGIKTYYECVTINCESQSELLHGLKNIHTGNLESLYDIIKFDKNLYPESDFEEHLTKTLIILDNIDRCTDIPDYVIDALFKTKSNVLMTYSVNSSVVKAVKEKLASHLNATGVASAPDEISKIIYPFDFILKPLSFEDYLEEFGSGDVILPTIEKSVSSLEKIPKIVFDNVNLIFEEYLYWGGFPGSNKDYINSDVDMDTVISQQANLHYYYYVFDMLLERGDVDLRIRSQCRYIVEAILKQMLNGSGYPKFSLAEIRDGATMQYYREAFDFLTENNVLIALDRYDNTSGIPTFYFCDCGMLYSLMLHTKRKYCTEENPNELIRYMCLRNYIVQEAARTDKHLYFWKSRYMANVDLLTTVKGELCAFKVLSSSNQRCRTPESFTELYPGIKLYMVTEANLGAKQYCYNIPYYAITNILN